MAHNNYSQYSGNPYGQAEQGYGSNPYGGTNPYNESNQPIGYATSNPYGGSGDYHPQGPPPLTHETSNYSQPSRYESTDAQPINQSQPTAPMSRDEFLANVEGVKNEINNLTGYISSIATIHQRILSSPDGSASAQLEGIVTQTQVLNMRIKDQIKRLETDAARDPNNKFKKMQVETLKRNFKDQLQEFQKEEQTYSQRYREAIARQYRIVNPDATEDEVNQAANADWSNEGIFQTALKSNRSAQATSVLGAVRARHNDIQRIEKTLYELAQLFEQLNEAVIVSDPLVQNIEDQTQHVVDDSKQVNQQLGVAIDHARRRQKLKWWTVGVVLAIIIVLALILGLYFGLRNNGNGNKNNNGP